MLSVHAAERKAVSICEQADARGQRDASVADRDVNVPEAQPDPTNAAVVVPPRNAHRARPGRAVIESREPIAVHDTAGNHLPLDLHLNGVGGLFPTGRPPVEVRIPTQLSDGVSGGTGRETADERADAGEQPGAWGRTMRSAIRASLCLLLCGVGVGSSPAAAMAAASAPSERTQVSSLLNGDPLVVAGVQPLDGGEQLNDAWEARRTSPEAYLARLASRYAYERLGARSARQVAAELFPGLISEPAGGPPSLASSERLVSFSSPRTAQLLLPGHKHEVVESTDPMAVATSPGHFAAIDLHLRQDNRGYRAVRSKVPVRIPRHASQGIALADVGVSLTPVTAQGAPVGGSEGQVDGVALDYANTATDTDTLAKLSTMGFSEETLLRGADSPRTLYFRVGLRAGEHITREPKGDGLTVDGPTGTEIARIPPPSAHDAEGTVVPVTITSNGPVITIHVAAPLESYRLPVIIDPSVEDGSLANYEYGGHLHRSNWHFVKEGKYFNAPEQVNSGQTCGCEHVHWREEIFDLHSPSEWGGFFYTTKGQSRITMVEAEGSWNDTGSHVQNYMVLYAPQHTETYTYMAEAGTNTFARACSPEAVQAEGCPEGTQAGAPENGNTGAWQQVSTGTANKGTTGWNELEKGKVRILQETPPEVAYNTSSPTIYNERTGENVPNVLWSGGETWLGPHHGAFEVDATDHGIGLSKYTRSVIGCYFYGFCENNKEFLSQGYCYGVQCPEYEHDRATYQGEPDGVLELYTTARNATLGPTESIWAKHALKIDHSPPHGLTLAGLMNGNELPSGETPLKAEATDGEGTTPSSGMQSIKITVDGHEVPVGGGSCPSGPCTAVAQLTLAARDYSSGDHTLVMTAMDNADNVAAEEFKFRVHAVAPINVGPASIEPSTGEATLTAADVSLGGATGVSRTYRSRHLTAGAEGPLGPQWQINVGGGEGLSLQPNGDAVVTSGSAASTTFTRNTKGGFESPVGDANLKLEATEAKPGEGVTGYTLSNPTAGTQTTFEQPAEMNSTPPMFALQFGHEAGELSSPISSAVDAGGDIWVTSGASNQVQKFSSTGTLLSSYGSYGAGGGQFAGPWGIAVDHRNGNVYVTDQGNSRVEELSSAGAFIKAFGWGVKNGSAEYQICTEAGTCHAGLAGSATGQFNTMAGVAVDAGGNVWVADFGNDRLQEFSEAGEFLRQVGSGTSGGGAGQMANPLNIAVSHERLYVSDYNNNRIDEYDESGAFVGAAGWGVVDGKAQEETCTTASGCQTGLAGSGNGQLHNPYGISADSSGDLYVTDYSNTRVQEFKGLGAYVTKFSSSGTGEGQVTGPTSVAVGTRGQIYVVDYTTNRVEEWTRPSWVPTRVGGPLAAGSTTYAYGVVEEEGKPVIQPTEVLAPIAPGVSCESKLTRGCRALTFNYAQSTTATGPNGEKQSEWGDYKGHLTRVYMNAWDPTQGKMVETEVAHYLYDPYGRLRAEWDPRLETSTDCGGTCSALKTIYGYEPAKGGSDRVTSVSVSGQEPWVLHYGTAAGDTNEGRLLSVIRPNAKTTLGVPEQEPYTEVNPELSTTKPSVGETMKVTEGKWTNHPLAITYQWATCTRVKQGELAVLKLEPIPGAATQTYVPLARDRGKKLCVAVTAINADGANRQQVGETEAVTGSSELEEEPTPNPPATLGNSVSTLEYGVPASGNGAPVPLGAKDVEAWAQKDDPVEGVAVFPPDQPMGWPAKDYKHATLNYWDTQGRVVNTATPSGAITTTEYNASNDAIRTLTADNRAAALKEGSKSAEVSKLLDTESRFNGETSEEQKKEEGEVAEKKRTAVEPGTELLETKGPQHKVKLGEGGAAVSARKHVENFYDEGSPEGNHYGIVTKTTVGAEYEGKEADVRTTTTSYSGTGTCEGHQVTGWTLRKATAVTTDPGGLDLTSTIVFDPCTGNVLERTSPAGNTGISGPVYAAQFGAYGTGKGQLKYPKQIALGTNGYTWVADEENNRLDVFNEASEFVETIGWGVKDGKAELQLCSKEASSCKAGIKGSGNGQFNGPKAVAIANGNVWVSDTGNNRLEELSETGAFKQTAGSGGTGKLQFNSPRGLTVDSHGNVWVADDLNSRVAELSETGSFVQVLGWGVKDGKASLEICTASAEKCQAGIKGAGNGELNEPKAELVDSHGNLWVSDGANNRLQEFNEKGEFKKIVGSSGSGQGQLSSPKDLKIDSHGNLWVVDEANSRVEEFNEKAEFAQTLGWGVSDGKAEYEDCTKQASKCQAGTKGAGNGQFNQPWGIVITARNELLVSEESNHRIERFKDTSTQAHTSQTIYYSAKGEASVEACRNHPEWAELPCQTQPAQQPEGGPRLPVSLLVYNIWDEIEKTTEKFGSTERIKAETYDPAGRAVTSETEAKPATDAPLPKVTNEYSKETGALVKQSTESGGNTQSVTSRLNTLGQQVEYTDADGNVAKYHYEEGPESDGRLNEQSEGKPGEEESSQAYAYDPSTGFMTELTDSQGTTQLKFTAEHDVEGKITASTWPNGMTVHHAYNQVGEATGLEYVKTTNCAEKCTWLSDEIVPSIDGAAASQTSTLAKESYVYDKSGRLTETQEEPAGKPCASRLYSYDEESNRLSLTTRQGSVGKCATEGGEIQHHTYDTANRLSDTGVTYESFDNITKLPAADTGAHEITSAYYVDGQIESQTENGKTNTYHYDPPGRTRETSSEGKSIVNHYAGTGESITWQREGAGTWTRNVPGIEGLLTATQTNTGTTTLQLHDLQGNIVATAGVSEAETKLLTSYNSTEYGVPQPGTTAPKYSWLAATGVTTELTPSGASTKSGSTYVPLVGKALQVEAPTSPGAFPDGAATTSLVQAAYLPADVAQLKHIAETEEAARQKAAEEAACRAAPESCSEDPSWSGDVSIGTADAIAYALGKLEIAYYLSGGEFVKKVLDILSSDLGVDFITKAKAVIEKKLIGFDVNEAADWTFHLGSLLQTCVEAAHDRRDDPTHPHCWLYFYTVVRKSTHDGPAAGVIPNFAVDPTVGYCPWGTYSRCLIVNEW